MSSKQPARDPRTAAARGIRTLIQTLLPPLALVFFVRVALAEAYRIPSASMEPTLLVGDWLFVNKLRYGPHIPFTAINLPGYAEPKRGDVLVFESPPQDPAIRITPEQVTPTLVKRMAGQPGDTLHMRAGTLYLNGVAQADPSAPFAPRSQMADEPLSLFKWQHSIELQGSRFGTPPAEPTLHDWGPLVVPAGFFFMLGDNRDISVDSRYYGLVPRANVRGRPMFIYYSFDPYEGAPYLRAATTIRWGRIGHWVR